MLGHPVGRYRQSSDAQSYYDDNDDGDDGDDDFIGGEEEVPEQNEVGDIADVEVKKLDHFSFDASYFYCVYASNILSIVSN